MMHNKQGLLIVSVFLALSVGRESRGQSVLTESPPNLVVIFVDDLGYGDLGIYGHPTIRTPNLDQMAREGMRFTQFYAAASVCTPSRAALLTGRYPIRSGLVQGIIPGRVLFPSDTLGLDPSEVTIADVLKQKQYATMAIGKWHLGHLPRYLPTNNGFDGYFGIPYSNDMDHVRPADGSAPYWNVPILRDTVVVERPADQTTLTHRYTTEAVQFIRQNAETPFFLYLAHSMPHIPLFRSRQFEGRSARGLYGDVVEEIDWSVGEILRALREEQLDQNTLVLFTSDNGPWLVQKENGGSAGLLRGGKGTTWEGGMREPMIAWWPGRIQANTIESAVTTTMDFLPTAAALAGAELPLHQLDGRNLLPLLTANEPDRDEFFVYYRGDRVYAARLGAWKAHFYTQTAYPSGALLRHDPPQLFRLDVDPSERFDVAADNDSVLAAIEERMVAHYHDIAKSEMPSIEAEDLIDIASVTGGELQVQRMTNEEFEWGGGRQLWWVNAAPGDSLVLPIDSASDAIINLTGFFTRAKDYGIFGVSVNGRRVGDLVDGFSQRVERTEPISFGRTALHAGRNLITITMVGKDARSSGYSRGYLVGIDGFLMREVR